MIRISQLKLPIYHTSEELTEAVRKALPVKRVSSSHSRGETVIRTEEALDEQQIRDAIDATGYQVLSISSGPCRKKGFLGLFG